MAATVQVWTATGAANAIQLSSAETGFTFGRNDAVIASTAIPRPDTTGTAYSFAKTLLLQVTAVSGGTSLSNRRIRLESAPATGVYLFFRSIGATYTQATAAVSADYVGTNGYIPNGWTLLSTTFQTWDAASATAVASQRNGAYVQVAIGIGQNYLGGAGAAIAIPNLVVQYDEQ